MNEYKRKGSKEIEREKERGSIVGKQPDVESNFLIPHVSLHFISLNRYTNSLDRVSSVTLVNVFKE